jgi:hypothetical protein
VKKTVLRKALLAIAFGAVVAVAMPAQAGLLEGLFGGGSDLGPTTQRSWKLAQFTWVKLAEDKESAAAHNLHPVNVDAALLKAQLGAIQVSARNGMEPLFDSEELTELTPVLARALSLARPTDDVLLLSNARRGGRMAAPTGVTTRLFATSEGLNVLVDATRFAFMGDYINTRVEPRFTYGSRAKASTAVLRGEGLMSKRPDWIVVPMASLAGASVPAAAGVMQLPARTAGPASATVTPTPTSPTAVAPAPGSQAALGDEIEQRLITLKRLRDKNLITGEEYQQKRREVLQKL